MLEVLRKEGPFRHRNVRLYTWFTLLYSARAYYPVFAILFLDLGLSMQQFVLLNAFWAAAIFLLEVPSGAVADVIGRRKLVVIASALMVAELLLLLLAPQNGGWLLFSMCVLNRILSGASEAAASGADQALAVDTLAEHGEDDQWDEVLAIVMKWRSAGFFVAMTIGGLLYDPRIINALLPVEIDKSLTLRLPVALVFIQSILCLVCSLRMREPARHDEDECADTTRGQMRSAVRNTVAAAKWVVHTPLAFQIVLGGLLLDSLVRNFVTLNSEYYRLIDIPTWLFGFLGSTVAALGFFLPGLFKHLGRKYSPHQNIAIVTGVVVIGLLGIAPAWSYWGVVPVIVLFSTFGWIEFISSKSLNALADSRRRATILSVKGLAFNVGYGTISLAYSGLLAWLEQSDRSQDEAFLLSLKVQPGYLLLAMALFFLYCRVRGTREARA